MVVYFDQQAITYYFALMCPSHALQIVDVDADQTAQQFFILLLSSRYHKNETC